MFLWLAMLQTQGIAQDQSADARAKEFMGKIERAREDLRRQIELQGKKSGLKGAPQDDRVEASSPPSGLEAALARIRRNGPLEFARAKRYGPQLVNSIPMLFVPIPAGRFTMRPPELPPELRVPWRTRGEERKKVTGTKSDEIGDLG